VAWDLEDLVEGYPVKKLLLDYYIHEKPTSVLSNNGKFRISLARAASVILTNMIPLWEILPEYNSSQPPRTERFE
jgi:hypothetical protein